jgi:hypothetical protein
METKVIKLPAWSPECGSGDAISRLIYANETADAEDAIRQRSEFADALTEAARLGAEAAYANVLEIVNDCYTFVEKDGRYRFDMAEFNQRIRAAKEGKEVRFEP